ncbi:MAG: glycosyltransferase [Dehalococcoidia bacterium]|nr:MAG: glycosyltransferase [Dehalococcoidia bacterium]
MHKKVFVHIDAAGTYLGNGGFNMLVSLAQEIANLGYNTYVFNPQDSFRWEDFDWLCWDNFKFEIASVDYVFRQRKDECVVVTSWLQGLLFSSFGRKLTQNTILNKFGINNGITPHNIRYWDQSELLRSGSKVDKVKRFCLRNCSKIAINNKTLEKYYRSLGFSNTIFLENWIRSDLFYFDNNKVVNSIGHQSDRGNYNIFNHLISHYGKDSVCLCEGNQLEVSKMMRKSDLYVFFNYSSPAISLFQGEVCGLSLFEAMACGCVCVAIKHEGNKFLHDKILLIQDMHEIVPSIESLINSPSKKDELRNKSVEYIETEFRFNKARKESLYQFID